MSVTAHTPELTSAKRPVEVTVLVLIVWAASVFAQILGAGGTPDLSTDDAMRLVQVRDWLAGQSWFDLTQYRLAPPDGVLMHWSRLVDVPIAALIRAGERLMPAALAERIAVTVWPAALLLIFLIGVARLARELAGDGAARLAVLFAALTASVLQHFRPGAVDHHNVQLVVLVWMLVFAVREPARTGDAAIAGTLAGASLAVGLEMTPAVVVLAAIVALRWIVQGNDIRQHTIAFALAFTVVVAALAVATTPPQRYMEAACDTLSLAQVVIAAIGGIGLAGLALASGHRSIRGRFLACTVLGGLLAVVVVLIFPVCLGDPYAHLDPRITALWLANVNEARDIISMLRDLPQQVPAYYGLPLCGLVLGAILSVRDRETRWQWMIGVAVLAALTAVALWQVRGAAAANALAAIMVPAALVRLFPVPDTRALALGLGRAALVAALVLNPLSMITLGGAASRAFDFTTGTTRPHILSEGPGTCSTRADYAPLKQLPRGLVLGFIDAGPFVLLETPHSVLAAPYHRNVRGNSAMLDVFLAPPAEAKRRFAALGVDYVAFCPGAPERYNYATHAPDSLVAVLGRGTIPDFLEPVTLDGTGLAVYRTRQ
jgi:hypothetical protein